MTKKIELHPEEEEKWAVVMRGEHKSWEGKYIFVICSCGNQAIFDRKSEAVTFRDNNNSDLIDTRIIRVSIKKV